MKTSLVIIITLAFKRHNTTPSTIIITFSITFAFKLHHNSTTMTEYNKLSEVSCNPKVRAWRFRVKIHRIYLFYSYVTNSGPFYTYVLADEDGSKMEMTVYGDYDRFRGFEKEEGSWVEIFLVEIKRSYPGFQATNSRFKLTATRYTQVRIIDPLNNWLFMDLKNIHAIPHMSHREQNYPIDTMGVVFNTEAHFDDPGRTRMVFYIRDNIDSQIKCVATGEHAYAFWDGLENMRGGQVIVALKMWRVWKFWNYFGPPDLWLETEGGISDFRFNPRLSEVEDFRQTLLNIDPYVQKYGVEGLVRKDTPMIPAIWVCLTFGDELDDAHPAPTLTRYPRSSYSSPTTGRGR
ncbi:hypothetical protein IGI04_040436 [Brassica rapa subsp. trilocularis]|uniref:Replication protein A 70 kDa DNA-binding subunit B/D first OB fold domain-containing protein n=1 Tax=Brassica rapa subsp. trilocularis TaxID=1813537 RepID=A0ABQ7KMU5_BRACM|nr:hypothetical protein IGI04_040436 [Brassica rapa subsp. trilocularis]